MQIFILKTKSFPFTCTKIMRKNIFWGVEKDQKQILNIRHSECQVRFWPIEGIYMTQHCVSVCHLWNRHPSTMTTAWRIHPRVSLVCVQELFKKVFYSDIPSYICSVPNRWKWCVTQNTKNKQANQDCRYKKKSDAIKRRSEWQGCLIYCPSLACGQAGSKEDSSPEPWEQQRNNAW